MEFYSLNKSTRVKRRRSDRLNGLATPTPSVTGQTDGSYHPLGGNMTIPIAAKTGTFKEYITIGDGTIAWDDENNCLVFNKGIVSESFISAFGIGDPSGGGGDVTIVDRLDSTSTDAALSANMGRYLKKLIDEKTFDLTSTAITNALDYTPYNSANFTKANIKSTLGIADWALNSTKPSYSFSEITGVAAFNQLPTMYWANVALSDASNENTEPTFKSIKIGGGKITWDSTNSCFMLDSGLASISFISAFGVQAGGGEVTSASSIKYNSQIFNSVDGVIDISQINISGGVSSWYDLTDKPTWIGESKPSYNFSEIGAKPTTISGYGITDAITTANIGSQSVANANQLLLADTLTSDPTQNAGAVRYYNGSGAGYSGLSSMQYAAILAVGGYSRGFQLWASRGDGEAGSLHFRVAKQDQSGWNNERTIIDSETIGSQSVLYAHGTRDKDHHDYTARYTTANNNFADGALHYYLATSSMTTGKPTQGDSHVLHLAWDNSTWESQLAVMNSGKGMQTRTLTTNGWSDWHTVAYKDDNVASATKLQTARTLWGNSFDGSANVSGDLLGATAICASDNYTSAAYKWSDGTNSHPWYGIHQTTADNGVYSTTITNYWGMQLRTRRDGVGYIQLVTNKVLPNADNDSDMGANSHMWRYGYFGWVGAKVGYSFLLGANNSTHMTIDTSGNVGVGTTTPAYKHDVNGDAYVRGWSRAGNGFYIENMGVHYTYQNQKDYECPLIYTSKNNVLQFSVGNSTWTNMYVNYYSPRYGYAPTKWIWRAGSSTSHADFEVGQLTATASTSGIIKLKRNTSGGAYIHYYHANSDADFWETGINTSNNFVWYWKGGTTMASLSSGGNFVAAGEITAYSDARLKTEIKDLGFRGALMPKSFVKDGKQSIGFIAQEVRELYPELVLGEETEDSYLSLNYGAITAVLACQTNDHERRIAELERENRELKKKLNIN